MNRFRLLFSSLWVFLQPFVNVFLAEFGPALAKSALAAVKIAAANLSAMPGAVKREHAYDLIVADLKAQGIRLGAEVTASMINAALEAAVQKVKFDNGR